MRTPEETARLSHADALAALEHETQRRCELGAAYHEEARRHADTESDLAEARAALAVRKSAWEQVADTEHRLRRECEDTIDTLRAEVAALREQIADDGRVVTENYDVIAAACGVPEWDYPGQVVRDVQILAAEVAALREVAGLVREWQAAEAALRLAADDPWRIGGAVAAVEAIEARLLAATLPEVSRG